MNLNPKSPHPTRLTRWWLLVATPFLLVMACLALLASTRPASAQGATTPPPPTTRPSAARGQDLFATNCVPCHGQQGLGDGPVLKSQGQTAPSFTQPSFHAQQTPNDIYTVISEGRIGKLMPPWKGRLNADQMWNLTYYSWWLGTGSATLSRGQQVWQAECAACHGPTGAGVPKADFSQPNTTLALSQTDLLGRAQAVADHAPVWSKLSAAEQVAALAYARSLGFDAPTASAAGATATGSVRGTIRNGTTSAAIAPGQVVSATLYSFVGMTPGEPVSATVDPQGGFKFEGLAAGQDTNYGVGVYYNGIQYFSPLIRLTADQANQTADLMVYEATATDPGMRIGQVHVITEFLDPKTLRVGELIEVQNPGQRTFAVPDGSFNFELTLPPGATNVRFQDESIDGSPFRDGNNLRLNIPWIPGSRQVLLAYDVPYANNLRLTRAWPYPTGEVNVLVEDVGVQAVGDGLQSKTPMDTPNGGRYLTLGAPSLAARQAVNITLSGTPRVDAAPPSSAAGTGAGGQTGAAAAVPTARVQASYQDILRWLGVILAVAAVVAFLAWPRLRPAVATGRHESLAATRERLLDQLADLDDAYALGEVRESDYVVQRADLKARLVAVMRSLRAEE